MADIKQQLMVGIPIVLTLVVIAILLGFGQNILSVINEKQNFTESRLKTNESISGNVTLSIAGDGIDNNTVRAVNISDTAAATNVLVKTTHYNVSPSGEINFTPDYLVGVVSGSYFVNVSYNYTANVLTLAWNSTEQGQIGLKDFSQFQGTLATIAAAVIIIGLLLGSGAYLMFKKG